MSRHSTSRWENVDFNIRPHGAAFETRTTHRPCIAKLSIFARIPLRPLLVSEHSNSNWRVSGEQATNYNARFLTTCEKTNEDASRP